MGTPSRRRTGGLLRSAYADAAVDPGEVGYVEAHGTGTRAGDPVELAALGDVCSDRQAAAHRRCWVGSVKTNIGHTEGAAGVAGLIKARSCVQHGQVPASLHLTQPNPRCPWADLPLRRPDVVVRPVAGRPPAHGRRQRVRHHRHQRARRARRGTVRAAAPVATAERSGRAARLSARSPEALRALAGRHAAVAGTAAGHAARARGATPPRHAAPRSNTAPRSSPPTRAAWSQAAAALRRRRGRRRREGARRRCRGAAPRRVRVSRTGRAVAGHGARAAGRGADFAPRSTRCDAAVPAGLDWIDPRPAACRSRRRSRHRSTRSTSCSRCCWPSRSRSRSCGARWGIEPDAVVGHSMGEVGAAHVAGALDLDEAMRDHLPPQRADAAHQRPRRDGAGRSADGRGRQARIAGRGRSRRGGRQQQPALDACLRRSGRGRARCWRALERERSLLPARQRRRRLAQPADGSARPPRWRPSWHGLEPLAARTPLLLAPSLGRACAGDESTPATGRATCASPVLLRPTPCSS